MLLVIGRRGGKTTTVFSEIIVPELVKKVQTIVAVYPTAKMGFKNFWNNIENDGFKTIEHIPKELIKRQSNDEDDMRIELINGSVFMVLGAGNAEALRGANGKLYWFDEFADMPIEAVNVVAPITDANGGKRIYTGTPKIDGINGETMRRMHVSFKKDPTKYTCYVKATEYMSEPQLEKVRQGYILRNGNDFKYKQEMLLDWGQSSSASYYGQIMSRKDKDGSIGQFPWNKAFPVYTAWDLGKADSMVVLFFQFFKGRPRIIDIIEKEGSNIKAMAKELKAKPYVYGWHFLPHDAMQVRQAQTASQAQAAKQILEDLGLRRIIIVPRTPIKFTSIQRARSVMLQCYFDETNCAAGITHLECYRKVWSKPHAMFTTEPVHDEHSETADAFQQLACGWTPDLRSETHARAGNQQPQINPFVQNRNS